MPRLARASTQFATRVPRAMAYRPKVQGTKRSMNGMELNSIRSLMRGNHSRPGVAASLSFRNAQQRMVRQILARKALGAAEKKPARLAVLGTNSSTAIYFPLL